MLETVAVPTRRLRVFGGMLVHETNSFSPVPTSLRAFEGDILHHAGQASTRAKAMQFPGYSDLFAVAAARGDLAVEGMAAWTQPSGPAPTRVYEALRDELLNDLRSAGAVDFVFLVLHGAMHTQGQANCESDLAKRVRAIVGQDTPIGVLLDLHGNVSPELLTTGAIVMACKEYPHTDYRARAEELYDILARMARRELHLTTVMARAPVVGLFGTTEQPMRGFVDRLRGLEGQSGALALSAMHGFPWGDTQHTGAAILAVVEASAIDRGVALAQRLAGEFGAIAASLPARKLSVQEAIDMALSQPAGPGPVVISDGSDNPGGGAGCDSTFILRALLDREVKDAAVGMIFDPQAALTAADAGVGARFPLRLGGKISALSGEPLDLDVEVLCVRDDAQQVGLGGDVSFPLGLAVCLRAAGVDVVVNSVRQQVFSTDCFSQMGVDPAKKAFVVVKSSQHFRASFDKIARATIHCNAPGSLNSDLAALPYRNLSRPLWPLDSLPTEF